MTASGLAGTNLKWPGGALASSTCQPESHWQVGIRHSDGCTLALDRDSESGPRPALWLLLERRACQWYAASAMGLETWTVQERDFPWGLAEISTHCSMAQAVGNPEVSRGIPRSALP